MPNLTIKPVAAAGNKLILQDQAGGVVLQTTDSGATLGTISGGTLGSGVTGGSGLDNLPNKHNRCITFGTMSGFNTTGVNPLNNSWSLTNIGNSDEIMTQSGGIFSFPSTGIYRIYYRATVYNSSSTAFNAESAAVDTYLTLDNGSNWTHKIGAYNHITFPANDWYRAPLEGEIIFDITDIAQQKIKFSCGTNPAINLYWGLGPTQGGFWFIKLGNT